LTGHFGAICAYTVHDGKKGEEMVAHLLFEQSGTFKNEFRKLGIDAYDYDIQNEFGQTDHVCDLFAEIESAFEGGGKHL
jgi:hypothetical protein